MGTTSTAGVEVVELTDIEYYEACYTGMMIHVASLNSSLREGVRSRRHSGMEIQQIGAIAEKVVAKRLDLYWSGAAFTFHGADLSHNIEVRAVTRRGYKLRVRRSDADSKRVVQVVMDKLRGPYEIWGWCFAGEAKQRAWWSAASGGWLVPRHELRPFAELEQLIKRERCSQA